MQRSTKNLAFLFFRLGAAVPLVLLLLWRMFFEHATVAVQDLFFNLAFVLWPTGIQILVVPHPQGSIGSALTIAILIVQNAILYSVAALLVHWIVVRVRHTHAPTH